MPELPEVESIAQSLRALEGKNIRRVRVYSRAILKHPSLAVEKILPGKKLLRIKRRAKYLIFELEGSWRLILHLGMTGQIWLHRDEESPFLPDKHTHFALETDGGGFYFRDIRKFGFVDLVRLLEEAEGDYFGRIGSEPFDLDGGAFVRALKKCRARIKPLLLGQRVVAGIGNIYADESLFAAGIRPTRKASGLSSRTILRLWGEIRRVLAEAVEKGGSSIDDYVLPDGSRGGYQRYHRVYGKSGRPCLACGTLIRKIVVGGRGTCFCPSCQR
ncbi:MAG: bifunctional DNA-formamidopyrimidine glycosylase/DNA-(apurinic or apyrimidinic site) lyase [Candidatus Omnitrophica bacterium]|nr:bifunctional DNA-formamidopyrimidine glycosylase/DNA-(apurinic or apyrimidinic site) lyase [Candidatus Omnitrophota bacterium]